MIFDTTCDRTVCLPFLLALLLAFNWPSLIEGDTKLWTYKDPTTWGDLCQTGRRQSPIDIVSAEAVGDAALMARPVKFVNFFSSFSGDFFNSGLSVQFTIHKLLEAKDRPRITGGGFGPAGFVFEQIHFHWGTSPDMPGNSEHTIDGQFASMEAHMLLFNSKYYSVTEAVGFPDGIAAVAFLFSAVPDSNRTSSTTEIDYSHLADLILNVTKQDSSEPTKMDFSKLIPRWVNNRATVYYRYNGSFSTPPCFENVMWTVYPDRISISRSAYLKFWNATATELVNATAHLYKIIPLAGNVRSRQNLAGRIVKTNKVLATASFLNADDGSIGTITMLRSINGTSNTTDSATGNYRNNRPAATAMPNNKPATNVNTGGSNSNGSGNLSKYGEQLTSRLLLLLSSSVILPISLCLFVK